MSESNDKLSKFISLILRHKPERIDETLDENGYMEVQKLINGIKRKGREKEIDFEILCEIVDSDEKGRYSFSEDKTKIRANQGHTVKVELMWDLKR
ncbi:MAG: RNA 2'-phosphotransferase [Sarcina sp.]